MADFGADVVMVEPPAGHRSRSIGARADEGTSVLAQHLLANKRSIAADINNAADVEDLAGLARAADVVVSSASPTELEHTGLAYNLLGEPSLIMLHVTPHGVTGSRSNVPGNDLSVAALSGWASINGQADREPLKPSGWQASYFAGTAAFAAGLAALHHRDRYPGEGQEVDVAELDVMVAAFAPALLRGQYQDVLRRRAETDMTNGPVPVADGHFSLTISRAHFWRDAMNLLDFPTLRRTRAGNPARTGRLTAMSTLVACKSGCSNGTGWTCSPSSPPVAWSRDRS